MSTVEQQRLQTPSPSKLASNQENVAAEPVVTQAAPVINATTTTTTTTTIPASPKPQAQTSPKKEQANKSTNELPPLFEFETKNHTPTKYVYLGKFPYNGRSQASSAQQQQPQQPSRGLLSSSKYNLNSRNPQPLKQQAQQQQAAPAATQQKPNISVPEGYIPDGVIHFNIIRTPYGTFSDVYQVFKLKKEAAPDPIPIPVPAPATSAAPAAAPTAAPAAAPVAAPAAAPAAASAVGKTNEIPLPSTRAGSTTLRQTAPPAGVSTGTRKQPPQQPQQPQIPGIQHSAHRQFFKNQQQQQFNANYEQHGNNGYHGNGIYYGVKIDFDELFGHHNNDNNENGEAGGVATAAIKSERKKRKEKRSSKKEASADNQQPAAAAATAAATTTETTTTAASQFVASESAAQQATETNKEPPTIRAETPVVIVHVQE